MTGSPAEREIRDAVVVRFRELWPGARIIHELNTWGSGSPRADLAAVTSSMLVIGEVKSERDTLDRLPHQLEAFVPVSHMMIVAAHEKFHLAPAASRQAPIDAIMRCRSMSVASWRYPAPGEWRLPYAVARPWHSRMLSMLWNAELRAECDRLNLNPSKRSTIEQMISWLYGRLTGPEIERAVCRQLRGRVFAEADPPIVDEVANA